MWFKNLQIYRLPAPWPMSALAIDQMLGRGLYSDPAASQATARGWATVRDFILYQSNGQWLLRLQIGKRLLPSAVVNAELHQRAAALTASQGHAPGRQTLRELKERVIADLLPKSHIIRQSTFVWIDSRNGWFVVDAGSIGRADEVIEHLRFCLDEFPLKPLHTQRSAQSAMADWLAGDAPAGFTVDRDCELKSCSQEKSAVAYKRHPLGDEVGSEVKAHLAAGKLPTRLALTWGERLSFVLTEKLEIKRLAFLDRVKEAAEQQAQHAEEQFDADFVLMTGELGRFLPHLVEALGGEVCDG